MADDPKTAAHRLVQEKRDELFGLYQHAVDPDVVSLLPRLMVICDVLELQIRRIDELENP